MGPYSLTSSLSHWLSDENSCYRQSAASCHRCTPQSDGTGRPGSSSASNPPTLQPGCQSTAPQPPAQPAATGETTGQSELILLVLSKCFGVGDCVRLACPASTSCLCHHFSISQQGAVSHMPAGVLTHQALGQPLVHAPPGGGAQLQPQWRQPLPGIP